MAKLSGVKPEEMNPRQRAVADSIVSGPRKRLGELMALWLHSPDLTQHVERVGSYFRLDAGFPRAVVEMIILITARHWNCDYEWTSHEPVAREHGLPDDVIKAIAQDKTPAFQDAGYKAAYDFTKAMLTTHRAPDDVIAALQKAYGPRGVIDASILIGHYIHGAIVAHAAGLKRRDGVAAPF